MEKVKSIRFEDTDKKIKVDIYGEEFEINENKFLEIKTDELGNEDNAEELFKLLEQVLGEGSIDKLNKIRKENGYGELEFSHVLAIFMHIIEYYTNTAMEPMNKMQNAYDNVYNNLNRYERRNNNNNYRRNNYKYRRY